MANNARRHLFVIFIFIMCHCSCDPKDDRLMSHMHNTASRRAFVFLQLLDVILTLQRMS